MKSLHSVPIGTMNKFIKNWARVSSFRDLIFCFCLDTNQMGPFSKLIQFELCNTKVPFFWYLTPGFINFF